METPPALLNLDKPVGMTSRAAVDRVIRMVGTRRVGHAGTLDPLASGVLVIAVGRASRLIEYVQRMRKSYCADILLGQSSDTDDMEGQVEILANAPVPTERQLHELLPLFTGTILQQPPRYSAVKVAGRRAYDLSRRGAAVELAARPVVIHAIRVEEFQFPRLRLTVECGSGTYIRALARDLGRQLGSGGVLAGLRRTAVGRLTLERAVSLEQLGQDGWLVHRRPLAEAVADLPARTVAAAQAWSFRRGQMLPWPADDLRENEVAVFDERGRLLGIGLIDARQGVLRPNKVGLDDDRIEEG